jgi:hypothetical protein
LHVQAQNFSRHTFGYDFHRATADLAICGETVRTHAGVHDDLKSLTAKGALNVLGNFHGDKLVLGVRISKCSGLSDSRPQILVFTNLPTVLAFLQMTNKSPQMRICRWQSCLPTGKRIIEVVFSTSQIPQQTQENTYDSFHPDR